MSRYERRAFFDRLCSLRDAYADRSIADRTPTTSIADVISWAEALLDDAGLIDATTSEVSGEGTGDTANRPA